MNVGERLTDRPIDHPVWLSCRAHECLIGEDILYMPFVTSLSASGLIYLDSKLYRIDDFIYPNLSPLVIYRLQQLYISAYVYIEWSTS
jgi:hypothetical protein